MHYEADMAGGAIALPFHYEGVNNTMPKKIIEMKNGSYKLTVSHGYDANGKQKVVTKIVKVSSQRAAQRAWEQFAMEINGDAPATEGQLTLRQFFDYYMTHYAKKHVTENTIQYDISLFRRIDKYLGQYALQKLKPFHVMDFIENLSTEKSLCNGNKTLSANTIQKHYAFLHAMLEKAVQWQFIDDNPAGHVDKPKRVKPPMEILEMEECRTFLEALTQEDMKHQALVFLAVYTGMRRGEIFGLQWKHVDFGEMIINVEQECQYNVGIGNHIVPRTKGGSARKISIPKTVCVLLRKYRREVQERKRILQSRNEWKGAMYISDDYIFCSNDGKLAHADQFNAWLDRFTEKHGFRRITPHTFRHMVVSYLFAAGVDLQTIAGKVGHANTQTTQTIYSHLLHSSEHHTASILQNLLSKK